MHTYAILQELSRTQRTIQGHPVGEILSRMMTEGVEILGLGAANLPLLSFLPAIGVRRLRVRDRRAPSADVLARLAALCGEICPEAPVRVVKSTLVEVR